MSSLEKNINEDDLLEKMLENFFEETLFDDFSNTSLSYACENEDFELVKFLVEKCEEDINYKCTRRDKGWGCKCKRYEDCGYRDLPLLIAISKNNIEITKYLIEKGANISYASSLLDYEGFYGWKSFKQVEYFEMMKLLYEKGYILKDDEIEYFLMLKSKQRSDLLKEDLVAKYHSPENIEKWSVYFNKPFDETIEIM